MEIFQPHLHGFGVKALVVVSREKLGAAGLAEMLRALGLQPEQLEDPNAWFSLALVERFFEELLQRTADPSVLDRVAEESLSPKALGFIYTLLSAFGSPEFAYRQIVRSTPRFNKIGEFVMHHRGTNKIELVYGCKEGAPRESSGSLCYMRMRQLALVPTLFGLPPAEVTHERCMGRGDAHCHYVLEWRGVLRRSAARYGAASGLAVGLGLAFFGAVPTWMSVLAGLLLAWGSWATGRVRELRRDISARVQDLINHQTALARSMRANEDRFQELLEAKAGVDLQVERRTAELKEATQRLSETLDEIQALDKAKTDFFNNVSHELRSPLTLILAPLEELVAGRTPAGGEKAAFEAMHRNSVRLLRLINQLLDLAKIDAGEMTIAPAPVDVIALVKGTLAGFEAAAEKKGVAVEVRVPPEMRSVMLDASWIESAVTNLVANALRLSKRGGVVRVTVEDHGEDVALSVSDDGPGIAPEDHEKVFERFAQGDSTKRVVGGTGIGLALVREAVRLHGGDVKLESELGKGATFTLTLPRTPEVPGARAPEAASPSQRPPRLIVDEFAEEVATLERPGPVPNAPLALVVEDNPELREFIANVLAARYRVCAAADGRQGVAMAFERRPDVVVSDVAMPEMDGYALCRALRAETDTKSTPILLVTARTEVASVLEGFDAGASDYILKPFHGRELLARVDVHVRLRRIMQEFAVRERHATLGVLAASVAHQVRNPLTTLVSGLPAMRAKLGSNVTESTRQLIDVMIDCAARIERMTVDLMDLSRVDREAGGLYQPSDGLRAAIRLVRARLPETVVIEELIDDAPTIDGRPGDMNHVFLNLLDNAGRAVEPEGRIRVQAGARDGHYVVAVGDSGPGIDPEVVQHIFEPFFTTRQAGEGTGLGLAVAQQVMLQCGGRIEVGRSELGGALFTVYIPIVVRASMQPPSHVTLH